ncbi:MAG TPA: SRPBCC domain-containing protein, partial [Pirellulales bacterium]|nr:SRPBCC domain-containing protein [Pirellulales bacterium]
MLLSRNLLRSDPPTPVFELPGPADQHRMGRTPSIPDGRVADSGEVLEIEPPRRLVLSWRNEFKPELRVEGYSRLTYELEQMGETVKLTVIHEMDKPGSKLIEAVSGGWPHILASLKSLLETGEALEGTKRWPKGV